MRQEAIKAALVALVGVYKVRYSEAPSMPEDDVLIRYFLQQIGGSLGAETLGLTLDDIGGECQIKPSLLIDLVKTALDEDGLKDRLSQSKKEADEAWKRLASARRLLKKRPAKGTPEYRLYGTAHKRHSAALYELGLIGEAHGAERDDQKHNDAAERYYDLRTGGYTHQNGVLVKIEPHGHDAAVDIVMDEFALNDWASLERAWRKKGIAVSYEAEVFPVK
ncbi:hypothetical protein LHU53_12455 [Rhodoferax sp. U2-2l]|uniref:hypothetical protein n=1 Tax=Rhodoferax sp. U2-2l TaxID=2884000 RepID=UPI001D0A5A85|nr:hypothetical protein [Rhodoferax sp. U2-2l]MCB8747716.1 hypothetical protein [Rhodoferax sp. U2-2l]